VTPATWTIVARALTLHEQRCRTTLAAHKAPAHERAQAQRDLDAIARARTELTELVDTTAGARP
jgi:hypothetical protein